MLPAITLSRPIQIRCVAPISTSGESVLGVTASSLMQQLAILLTQMRCTQCNLLHFNRAPFLAPLASLSIILSKPVLPILEELE